MNWEDLAEQVSYLKQNEKLYDGEISNFCFSAYMNQIKRMLVTKASLFWANKEYLCVISSRKNINNMENSFYRWRFKCFAYMNHGV